MKLAKKYSNRSTRKRIKMASVALVTALILTNGVWMHQTDAASKIYIDYATGNDANSGTSPKAPVKSYSKAKELAGGTGEIVDLSKIDTKTKQQEVFQELTAELKSKTDTPKVAKVPEVTVTPQATPVPQVTATPEATVVPEEAATPEATVVPEEAATPEATVVPEATATPEATVVPEVTATPEATETPENTETQTPEETGDASDSKVKEEVQETSKNPEESKEVAEEEQVTAAPDKSEEIPANQDEKDNNSKEQDKEQNDTSKEDGLDKEDTKLEETAENSGKEEVDPKQVVAILKELKVTVADASEVQEVNRATDAFNALSENEKESVSSDLVSRLRKAQLASDNLTKSSYVSSKAKAAGNVIVGDVDKIYDDAKQSDTSKNASNGNSGSSGNTSSNTSGTSEKTSSTTTKSGNVKKATSVKTSDPSQVATLASMGLAAWGTIGGLIFHKKKKKK